MLVPPTGVDELGTFVTDILTHTSWVTRRVETVRHVDKYLLERRSTFDLDIEDLRGRAAASGLTTSSVPIFLAIPVKQLLLDVDITLDDGFGTIASRSRDVDMSAAALWHMLALAWRDDLRHVEGLLEAQAHSVVDRNDRTILLSELKRGIGVAIYFELRRVTGLFPPRVRPRWRSEPFVEIPGSTSAGAIPRLRDFSQPLAWLGDQVGPPFETYLEQFWRRFLLRVNLPLPDAKQTDHLERRIKLRYTEALPDVDVSLLARLGLRGVAGSIPVDLIGYAGSEHVRLHAPPGLIFTTSLVRQFNGPEPPNEPESAGIPYSHRLTPTTTHLYTVGRKPKPDQQFDLAYAFRPGDTGIASRAWWLTSILAALLVAGAARICAVAEAESDAAVALLLVVPSALTLFIASADEHPVYRWMIRPLRAVVLLGGLLPLVAGAVLLVEDGQALERTWVGCAALSVAIALVCCLVKVLNVVAERSVRRHAHETHFDRALRRPLIVVIDQLSALLGKRELRRALGAGPREFKAWATGQANPPRRQRAALVDVFRHITSTSRAEPGPLPVLIRHGGDYEGAADRTFRSLRLLDRVLLHGIMWQIYRPVPEQTGSERLVAIVKSRKLPLLTRARRDAVREVMNHRPDAPWLTARYATVKVPDLDGRHHRVECLVLPLGLQKVASAVTADAFIVAAGPKIRTRLATGAIERYARSWRTA